MFFETLISHLIKSFKFYQISTNFPTSKFLNLFIYNEIENLNVRVLTKIKLTSCICLILL